MLPIFFHSILKIFHSILKFSYSIPYFHTNIFQMEATQGIICTFTMLSVFWRVVARKGKYHLWRWACYCKDVNYEVLCFAFSLNLSQELRPKKFLFAKKIASQLHCQYIISFHHLLMLGCDSLYYVDRQCPFSGGAHELQFKSWSIRNLKKSLLAANETKLWGRQKVVWACQFRLRICQANLRFSFSKTISALPQLFWLWFLL